MARIRFVGHLAAGWAGPDPIQIIAGVWLRLGEWEEVGDDVASRLSGHPEVEAGAATPSASTDPADWRTFNKAQLDAHAEAQGIKLDKRQSLAKMQAAFAEASGG